jgi:hypothetical protein
VIGEELGFVGVAGRHRAFFWLTRRIFLIGRQAMALDRVFAGLMAQGIGIWMGGQAFINMGVNLGVLPTKGLTLPLMSYGGSAILMNLVALAIVLRVDMENRASSCGEGALDAAPGLVVMAAGTGGHIIPGLAVARRCSAAAGRVSWLGTATGMETAWCRHRHPAGHDRLQRPARQGPAAHGCRRAAPAQGLLGLRGHPAPARCHAVLGMGGYVCFPAGLMASLLGKPLVLVNADARCCCPTRPAAGGRPRGLRLRRRAASAQEAAGRCHRQPGARRDRGAAPPGRALRRPQRPAALLVVGGSLGARVLNETLPAALALMPGRSARASRTRPARSTWTTCAPPTPPPASSRPRASRCCPSSTTWRAPGRLRPDALPRRRHHRQRAVRGRRAQRCWCR